MQGFARVGAKFGLKNDRVKHGDGTVHNVQTTRFVVLFVDTEKQLVGVQWRACMCSMGTSDHDPALIPRVHT